VTIGKVIKQVSGADLCLAMLLTRTSGASSVDRCDNGRGLCRRKKPTQRPIQPGTILGNIMCATAMQLAWVTDVYAQPTGGARQCPKARRSEMGVPWSVGTAAIAGDVEISN